MATRPHHRLNFSEADLDGLARQGNLAVLRKEILADMLTPVAAFVRAGGDHAHSFLLESVQGGERSARYSFLGGGARRVYRLRRGRLGVQEDGSEERLLDGEPLTALRREWSRRRPVGLPGQPPFTGGLVGFFSYDLVRSLERLPEDRKDDLGIPDAVLADYDTVLAFDHPRNRLLLMSAVDLDGDAGERRVAYQDALRRIEALETALARPLPGEPGPALASSTVPFEALPDAPEFLSGVRRAQEAIRQGEIFQVVLSRRFTRRWQGAPLSVYRALRSLNPSPYHFFLACDGDHLAGASPETLVRVEGRRLTLRPIAGTRPRGRDALEDRRLQAELLADQKERAEHVMLVDLARNDAGRVSRAGTVRVEEFLAVERYSHVMHLVSSVTGELRENKDALDALAAAYPAGTLTGAPKVRAMQIIDESEPFRRGPYGGAVLYLDHGGDLDSCITIRTAVITGGDVHVQAGAGIVADSRPHDELAEIDHKAEAMLAALEQAERELP